MQFLKRLLRVLAVLSTTYIVASVIEALILVVIAVSKAHGQSLTINTADIVSFCAIWMVLYVVVGRRYLRRKKRA